MSKIRVVAAILALVMAGLVLPISGQEHPSSRPAGRRPTSRRARPRRHFRRVRLTPERTAEVIAFAKEYLPALHERIEKYRKEQPEQAPRLIRWGHWVMQQTLRYPPEVRPAAVGRYRALYQIRRNVLEISQTDNAAEKAKLTAKLRKLLGQQFDYDQTLKEYRVKRLAKRLADLKAEIQQRRRNRDKVIAEALERLLQPPVATQPASAAAAKTVKAD